ncbi:hypothetical protein K6981_05550 [Xanthomonas cucurbitae]|nr:hypothetical protein K6981_05550 [Xanthomonas cucurbitae]
MNLHLLRGRLSGRYWIQPSGASVMVLKSVCLGKRWHASLVVEALVDALPLIAGKPGHPRVSRR